MDNLTLDKAIIEDIFRIPLPKHLVGLDKDEKIKAIDAIASGKKKLIVTMPMSASDKVINRRIYPSKGMKAGLSSWTQPYRKPMLINHDMYRDAIGRVQKVWYAPRDYSVDFKNPKEYARFKEDIDSYEPDRIYDALMRNGFINKKKWEGTGLLMGDFEVVDLDAIEKFIDERYLTGSSGHVSDRWVCSGCLKDWMKEGYCECGPMKDGKPTVNVLGMFIGKEFSMVNSPANDSSVRGAMRFADSASIPDIFINSLETEVIDFEKELCMDHETNQTEEAVETQTQEVTASVEDLSTQEEVSDEKEIKEKGLLVDELVAKILERFNVDLLKTEIVAGVLAALPAPSVDAVEVVEEKQLVKLDDSLCDWFLLDAAVEKELGDKKVDIQKDAFVPLVEGSAALYVVNEDYAQAIKTVVGKSSLAQDTKDVIFEAVDLRLKAIEKPVEVNEFEKKFHDAQKDLQNALETIQSLQIELDKFTKTDENVEVTINTVEDPQVGGSVGGASRDSLGKFERDVVDRYKQLAAKDQARADAYIADLKRRRLILSNFNPLNF